MYQKEKIIPLPAFNENTLAIVFIADDYFTIFASVTIESIIKNSSDIYNYDIIFFHRNISIQKQELLKQMVSEKNNASIRFFNVQEYSYKYALFRQKGVLPELFYRFLIPELMSNYEKALYVDSDIVFCKDVADINKVDLDECMLAATRDICGFWNYYDSKSDYKFHLEKELMLKFPQNYFNAGFMFLNLKKIRKAYPTEELWSILQGRYWKYKDQDAFNFLCNENVFILGYEWNLVKSCDEQVRKYMPMEEIEKWERAFESPYVVHYASDKKPWIDNSCELSELFWINAINSPFYKEILLLNSKENMAEIAKKKLTFFKYLKLIILFVTKTKK